MPSTSQKQHNLMAMVANDPAKAKQMGIPQSVGQEFVQADKGLKFGKGATKSRADLQKINKPKTLHGKDSLMKEGGQIMATKKMAFGGASGRAMPTQSNAGGASRGLDRAAAMSGRAMPTAGGMKKGGITTAKMGKVTAGGIKPHGEHTVQKSGHTKAKMPTMKGMKPMGMKKGGKAC